MNFITVLVFLYKCLYKFTFVGPFCNRSNYWNKVHFVGSLNFAEIWFAILIVCFVSKSFGLVYLGLKLENNNMTVHTFYAQSTHTIIAQLDEINFVAIKKSTMIHALQRKNIYLVSVILYQQSYFICNYCTPKLMFIFPLHNYDNWNLCFITKSILDLRYAVKNTSVLTLLSDFKNNLIFLIILTWKDVNRFLVNTKCALELENR